MFKNHLNIHDWMSRWYNCAVWVCEAVLSVQMLITNTRLRLSATHKKKFSCLLLAWKLRKVKISIEKKLCCLCGLISLFGWLSSYGNSLYAHYNFTDGIDCNCTPRSKLNNSICLLNKCSHFEYRFLSTFCFTYTHSSAQ